MTNKTQFREVIRATGIDHDSDYGLSVHSQSGHIVGKSRRVVVGMRLFKELYDCLDHELIQNLDHW